MVRTLSRQECEEVKRRLEFVNEIVGGVVPQGITIQRLIKAFKSKCQNGILAGYPVVRC